MVLVNLCVELEGSALFALVSDCSFKFHSFTKMVLKHLRQHVFNLQTFGPYA